MIAEYERAQILERTRRGRLEKARRGAFLPWAYRCYGYRYLPKRPGCLPQVVIDLEEAEVVRRIYRLLVEDQLSCRQITKRLNEALSASPSAALPGTVSAGCFTPASWTDSRFRPRLAPGGLRPLPLARGVARQRQPLRCRRRRRGRHRGELLGHRGGDPHEGGEPLALCGAAGGRLDPSQQRPGLVGAARDVWEASEQCEALKHGAPPASRCNLRLET